MEHGTWNESKELTSKDALLESFATLLAEFTSKHNLISSNTVKQIQEVHIAHCLALAKQAFPVGSTVVDWGTGGGLPAKIWHHYMWELIFHEIFLRSA